jgi:hypothetical protein
MKKNILKLTSLLILQLFIGNVVLAQLKTVSNFMSAGVTDGQTLIGAYLKPYANAFGADLNGGWYNTAKPHKTLGFDLTFTVNTAMVPKADKTFDVSKLNFQTNPTVTGDPMAPTIAGKNSRGPQLGFSQRVGGTDYQFASFNTPKGTGVGVIPAPMLQLGIGIVKETELIGRYVPQMNFLDNGSVDMWGIGIKHSLKQWIPAIKSAPFFHLAFLGGYTQLRSSVKLNLQPSFYNESLDPDPVDNTNGATFDNQKMEMIVKGMTFNLLASFDFPVISIYAGAGISNTKTTLKLKGDYPMPEVPTSGPNVGNVVINNVANPINMELKSMDGSPTKPRLNGGIRFKFAVITLHFDYTYANYSLVTAGLGLSIR